MDSWSDWMGVHCYTGTYNKLNLNLHNHTFYDTVKLQTEITYSLECPHCNESLDVKLLIATWADKCVREIGYDIEYGDESNNLLVKCEECGHEFEIDGVEAPTTVYQ